MALYFKITLILRPLALVPKCRFLRDSTFILNHLPYKTIFQGPNWMVLKIEGQPYFCFLPSTFGTVSHINPRSWAWVQLFRASLVLSQYRTMSSSPRHDMPSSHTGPSPTGNWPGWRIVPPYRPSWWHTTLKQHNVQRTCHTVGYLDNKGHSQENTVVPLFYNPLV